VFGKMIANWREARGSALRREVEDTMLRLGPAGDEVNFHACLAMADSYHSLLERCGSISNMSAKGKKSTAKMLYQKARGCFDLNMGQGCGLFLLSAYVEAQTLPGNDAAFVKESMETMLQAALQAKKDMDPHPK
jgi:hypothetical protein